MDPFEGMESDDELDGPPAAGGRPIHHLPLQHFLRIIARGRLLEGDQADCNDDLVRHLQDASVIKNEALAAAMRACDRREFVPEAYKEEAYLDLPIRVEDMDFNISAPHMHATCIEALEVAKGQTVLDVGSGCGVVAAYCAMIVGRKGKVVGIDIKRECVDLARENLRRLETANAAVFTDAAPLSIEQLDAFLLGGSTHKGAYDRIHVGGSCPPERLQPFINLLKPDGGKIVVPVAPSDLRVITLKPNGAVSQRVVSQVRFSELDVPGDAEIVLSTLRMERKGRLTEPAVPSTYAADVAAVAQATRWKESGLSSSPVDVLHGLPPSPAASASMDIILLKPDCTMVGSSGWEVSVHSAVLRQRCDHFRARCDSGMADAELSVCHVPDHFPQKAVDKFLRYLYEDKLDVDGENEAVEVLHLAQYYGVPRLAAMCEGLLAKALRAGARSERTVQASAETAAQLLALAFDHSLPHLQAVALDFVVSNFEVVSKTEAYAALSRDHVALVAAEACRLHSRTKELLTEVSKKAPLADP